jgi:hypothetical protein
VLVLSPDTLPCISAPTLDKLSALVMYQGGTPDFGITPALLRPGGVYEQSRAPKYLVEIQGRRASRVGRPPQRR